jgi:transposase
MCCATPSRTSGRTATPATPSAPGASWYTKARRSRIEPLKRFAANLKPYLPGILAHCRFPLGTNLIEGINNKIKVIKCMAYGFRDDAYFFLKIRAAFPGVG